MRDAIYLGWRYLAYHLLKTAVLVASITLIVYLPVGLNLLVSRSALTCLSPLAYAHCDVGASPICAIVLHLDLAGRLSCGAHLQATPCAVVPAPHEKFQHRCDLDHMLGHLPSHQGLEGKKTQPGRGPVAGGG